MKQRPFLKWAGGKYRIIDNILKVLPSGRRLIEPFVGAGTVFLNTQYAEYLLGDNNQDLINLYHFLQKEGQSFIDYCGDFFISQNNCPDSYYHFRELFNTTQNLRLKAALFLYFNRHGYNGLCRYNAQGKFNVPFGRYKRLDVPTKKMQFFQDKSQNALFQKSDFAETMAQAKKGDIVYCDPPYIPLTKTAFFTKYSKEPFAEREQRLLAKEACRLAKRGVPVVISNHDTPFTREIYAKAKIIPFAVSRFISRDINNRKEVKELLAVFLD
jgi:DNA adenine methylase